MIESIIVTVLTALAGVSLGSLGTVLFFKAQSKKQKKLDSKLEALERENQALRLLVEERGEIIRLLKNKIEELETYVKKNSERLDTLEDLSYSLISPKSREKNPKKHQKDETKEENEILDIKIWVMYNNGYSIRQIAKELGISKSTVHRKIKKILRKNTHNTPLNSSLHEHRTIAQES